MYTSLVVRGRLQKGDSVLIHSGTGGVGLAALYVATYFECNIFTTVGTREKRDYLRNLYPGVRINIFIKIFFRYENSNHEENFQIPESHIGNSRDTSFEDMINRETNGRGVDVILNSLSEEKLQASMRCLAKGGRFLEIGKFDLSNDNPIGTKIINNNNVQLK